MTEPVDLHAQDTPHPLRDGVVDELGYFPEIVHVIRSLGFRCPLYAVGSRAKGTTHKVGKGRDFDVHFDLPVGALRTERDWIYSALRRHFAGRRDEFGTPMDTARARGHFDLLCGSVPARAVLIAEAVA